MPPTKSGQRASRRKTVDTPKENAKVKRKSVSNAKNSPKEDKSSKTKPKNNKEKLFEAIDDDFDEDEEFSDREDKDKDYVDNESIDAHALLDHLEDEGEMLLDDDTSVAGKELPQAQGTPKTKKKTMGSKRSISPLLDLMGDMESGPSTSDVNFSAERGSFTHIGLDYRLDTPYLAYNARGWSPAYLYRMPADVILRTIKEAGSEGIGRFEIGLRLGYDTGTKAGNRKISGYIQAVCQAHDKYIGQFQKMEGKYRCIKYFWKVDAEPENFRELFAEWKLLTETDCPFKIGDVIKFSEPNLSTLRISDVSMRRLNDLLRIVEEERVVVTLHRAIKFVQEKENALGYNFTIDKKSLMKCIKALEKHNLICLFVTTVVSDAIANQVHVLCHRSITSSNHPQIEKRVQDTIDMYHKEGRVFPHGQLRFSSKKKELIEAACLKREDEASLRCIADICNPEDCVTRPISLDERYRLFRLQNSTNVFVVCHGTKENKPSIHMNADADVTVNERNATLHNSEETLYEEASDGVEVLKSIGKKRSANSESSLELGFQGKAIRMMIVHETLYQFVYGHNEGTEPNFYQRYPIGCRMSMWHERSVDSLPVYVDELSHWRFIPPMPSLVGLPRGWFMIQDALIAMPLSILVLWAYVAKEVNRPLLHEYLRDPVKRHICVGDLPNELRLPILKDKRAYRMLEHTTLLLCGLGLGAIAENPDQKRFPSNHTSVFYLCRKAELYDTSTSGRGYSSVSLPISQYDKYIYEFHSQMDVNLYWNHLRAIVQSTPVGFRNDVIAEDIALNRHKNYSIGCFDKSTVLRKVEEMKEENWECSALEPREGCAGLDSALYIHLRRHWDVNPRPTASVGWFVSRFRKQSDAAKTFVERRVRKLQSDWNSLVKSLMPTDLDLSKKKKYGAVNQVSSSFPATRTTLQIEPKAKSRTQTKRPANRVRGGKKRALDSVDIVSEQSRINVRSRFNSRERDMLILIRAVGFFLNPVYRFWLDPTVLRDIMHEFVPESRCKTVQSLMAAGVREMVRPQRLQYLQRIVRSLATFQEMRDLRYQLMSSPLHAEQEKGVFFKSAFEVANRLLFMDHQAMPSVAASGEVFENFIRSGQITISAESASTTPIPLRSQKPTTLAHIQHCIAVNLLLSVLVHSGDDVTQNGISEQVLEQISATVVSNALQVLRTDGLVSRARFTDPALQVITKNHAVLSYYFRHFFAHRFHPDLVDELHLMLLESDQQFFDAQSTDDEPGFYGMTGDHAAHVLLAASTFFTRAELEVDVPGSVLDVFESAAKEQAMQDHKSNKQIRYLENANLQLEALAVDMLVTEPGKLPDYRDLIQLIDRSKLESNFPPAPFGEWLATKKLEEEDRRRISIVYAAIEKSSMFGVCMHDIALSTKLKRPVINKVIDILTTDYQILEVGVDTRRWVVSEFAEAWTVVVENRRICPRPWTLNSTGVCAATVRWIAESCLMSVVANPGIPIKDLHFRFEFALQPAALDDTLHVLEAAGCVIICEELFDSLQLASPFALTSSAVVYTYVLPTPDCIERFSRIFGGIPLLTSMTGNKDDTEDETMRQSVVLLSTRTDTKTLGREAPMTDSEDPSSATHDDNIKITLISGQAPSMNMSMDASLSEVVEDAEEDAVDDTVMEQVEEENEEEGNSTEPDSAETSEL